MMCLLPWSHKRRCFRKASDGCCRKAAIKIAALTEGHCAETGSLTIEALLAMAAVWFCSLLMIALIQTAGQLLDLDRALSASAREITAASYALQQGVDLAAGGEDLEGLLPTAVTCRWAERCLKSHMEDFDRLKPALVWKTARCPQNMKLQGSEDVLLSLAFCPSKLESAAAALLPGRLTYTLTKQQKAWLVGRELLPNRGLEESAAAQKKGPPVYITRWGTHYHREDCRYLSRSKILCRLDSLAGFYEPCSVCRPPPRPS